MFPESSRVIKLARPDEKPAGPGCRAAGLPLSVCVCVPPGLATEMDDLQVKSMQHRATCLPEADMHEKYF